MILDPAFGRMRVKEAIKAYRAALEDAGDLMDAPQRVKDQWLKNLAL
jgi:hypothetical protein